VFSCGWNEHGNLGTALFDSAAAANASANASANAAAAKQSDFAKQPIKGKPGRDVADMYKIIADLDSRHDSGHWKPVILPGGSQLRLATPWAGALACGGAHCLCLSLAPSDIESSQIN